MIRSDRSNLRHVVLPVCVLAVALWACNSKSGSDSKDKPQANAGAKPELPKKDAAVPAPPTPTIAAQLFVDTSGSMAGFFGASKAQKDAATMLAAVHEEIDLALSESGLGSAKKCTVGDKVKCDGVPVAPAKLASPALYHEITSRLDQVLARAPTPAQVDPNKPPPADPLDDARVSLLLTDGMQVLAEGAAGSASCATGADPTCVRALLEKRIAEGFGVWLIGVLLPFNGTHFPERNLNASYFDQARAHVDQLKFDTRNLGVTFAITGKLGTDGTSGKSTYKYQGYKPLLIFVFSRDATLARTVVGTIVKKLRSAPIRPGKMTPEDSVQTVELAPLSATDTRSTRLELVPQKEQQAIFGDKFDPAKLVEFKLQEGAAFGGGFAQKAWCGSNGRSMLYLHYDQTGERMLPSYFKEQVGLMPASGIPPGVVAAPSPNGENRILTGVNCATMPKGPNNELGFTLQTQLALDESLLDKQWWSRSVWSSEDAWQMPERVYRLEDIILPIIKARATRATAWDRVIIHVQRD